MPDNFTAYTRMKKRKKLNQMIQFVKSFIQFSMLLKNYQKELLCLKMQCYVIETHMNYYLCYVIYKVKVMLNFSEPFLLLTIKSSRILFISNYSGYFLNLNKINQISQFPIIIFLRTDPGMLNGSYHCHVHCLSDLGLITFHTIIKP